MPLHGEKPSKEQSAVGEKQLRRLGLLCILESKLLNDNVRRWLLDEIDGKPWSYDDVYQPSPEAILSVDEKRPADGATHPAREIHAHLNKLAENPKEKAASGHYMVDCFGVREVPQREDRPAEPVVAVEGGTSPNIAWRLRQLGSRLRGRRAEDPGACAAERNAAKCMAITCLVTISYSAIRNIGIDRRVFMMPCPTWIARTSSARCAARSRSLPLSPCWVRASARRRRWRVPTSPSGRRGCRLATTSISRIRPISIVWRTRNWAWRISAGSSSSMRSNVDRSCSRFSGR